MGAIGVLLGVILWSGSTAMADGVVVGESPGLNHEIHAEDQFQQDVIPNSADLKLEINLRLIHHGARLDHQTLERQLNAAQAVFSQCPGLHVQLNVVDELETSYTQNQDNLTAATDGKMHLTPDFFNFFEPTYKSREDKVIDIHFVDYLSQQSREEHAQTGRISTVFLGQAFSKRHLPRLYDDPRQPPQTEPATDFSGNSVVIAAETLKFSESQFLGARKPSKKKGKLGKVVKRFRERNSSLITHEIGHILLETQAPDVSVYHDHYCGGLGDICPSSNVMSPGGYKDLVHVKVKNESKVLGYSPLPHIEPAQCEVLKNHPYFQR